MRIRINCLVYLAQIGFRAALSLLRTIEYLLSSSDRWWHYHQGKKIDVEKQTRETENGKLNFLPIWLPSARSRKKKNKKTKKKKSEKKKKKKVKKEKKKKKRKKTKTKKRKKKKKRKKTKTKKRKKKKKKRKR
ncbi:hypothetical protein M8J77_011926 [Diaphorina citri]|nr:hypothetical protein M8J77_011926 [Diaphorina citri]